MSIKLWAYIPDHSRACEQESWDYVKFKICLQLIESGNLYDTHAALEQRIIL